MVRRIVGSIAVLAVLIGCDGSSSGTGTTDESIGLAAGVQTVAVTQGGTASIPFTVTRSGGYAGNVTVTAEGLPAGLTSEAVTVAGGTTAGSLTITAAANAAPATANVTLRATGSGVSAATATVPVTVNVRGTYTLQATNAAVTVQQGASATTAVRANRADNFAGAVTLTATAPAGITVNLQPATLTAAGDSAVLAVTVGAAVAPGQHTVTITGATPGLANRTTTLTVTVSAVPTGSYTMAVTPSTVEIAAGGQATATINLTRSNFTGAVALTATAPAGITANVAPASVTGTQASVAVSVGTGVAPGTYTITVNGAAAGVEPRSATLTVQVPQPANYTMAVTPATVVVAAGGQGTATVNLARTNFTGAVALNVDAPAGITVTAVPASVTGTTSTLTVAVAGGTAPGTYNVTVNGTAQGIAARSATFAVQVTEAAGVSLSLTPQAAAVQQGGQTTVTVQITRTGGFTGDVALTTGQMPNGITASFTPATLSGNVTESTLTISAAGNAATGPAQVTVRGTGTGVPEATATLALTVNQSQGGAGNVKWTFCGSSGIPLWVAAQDGNGAWTRVTGNASNEYSFQVSSGRGGIMWVLPSEGGGYESQAFFGTTTELQLQGAALCSGTTGAGITVTGTATGVTPPFDLGFVTLGQTQAQLIAGETSFTLANVVPGVQDLVAVHQRGTYTGTRVTYEPLKYVIRRDLNPTNGSTLDPIDFAAGITPQQGTVTFQNLSGDWSSVTAMYQTPRNTLALLHQGIDLTSSNTRPWWGVPQASRQAGELHLINAIATVPNTNPLVTQTRQVMIVTADAGNVTAQLGPALTAPTVSVVATSPMVRLSVAPVVQAEYDRYYTVTLQQGENASYRQLIIFKTRGYVDAGGPLALVTPDVATVSGWNTAWQMQTGLQTTWKLTASGWTGTGVTQPVLVDGARIYSATRMNAITP